MSNKEQGNKRHARVVHGGPQLRRLAEEIGVSFAFGPSQSAQATPGGDGPQTPHKTDKLTIGRPIDSIQSIEGISPNLQTVVRSLGAQALGSRFKLWKVETPAMRYGRDFYLWRAHIVHTRQWFASLQNMSGYPAQRAAKQQTCFIRQFNYNGRITKEGTVIFAQLQEDSASAGVLADENRFFSEQFGKNIPQDIDLDRFNIPILLTQFASDSDQFISYWRQTHERRAELVGLPVVLGAVSCVPYVRFVALGEEAAD